MAVIYGNEIEVEVGSVIKPDGWGLSERLQSSDWDRAQFRLPTGHQICSLQLAVNVAVTGRTLQRREGDLWVRVKIEFVGDCEPSTFHSGWMLYR